MEKVVFQPFSRVGDGVVVLTDTGFGHNAVVGDFCYISGGCCIAAMVSFGPILLCVAERHFPSQGEDWTIGNHWRWRLNAGGCAG